MQGLVFFDEYIARQNHILPKNILEMFLERYPLMEAEIIEQDENRIHYKIHLDIAKWFNDVYVEL